MSLPGIKQDGTNSACRQWRDGQWVRFVDGLPRKIGGYKSIESSADIIRGISLFPSFPGIYAYLGTHDALGIVSIDASGVFQFTDTVTPATLRADLNNLWTFDSIYSSTDEGSVVLAHASPSLLDINTDIETDVFYGNLFSTDNLVSTGQTASGGIVVLHPYVFMFGSDGYIKWSNANDPTTILNSARPTANKIITGMPMRGGQNSPAGLFWSLNSLLRCTMVGTSAVEFAFDVISNEISIMSSRSVVEVDGVFYWVGTNGFFLYNGAVRKWENSFNKDFFFGSLNRAQAQKVWVTRVSAFDEIWIHYPSGDSTECDAAIIYNTSQNIWYDALVDRSCGAFYPTFNYPVWCDSETDVRTGKYPLWMHENGVDKDLSGQLTAIDSYIKTSEISNVGFGPSGQLDGTEKSVCLRSVELDLIQTGDMSLTVYTSNSSRGAVTTSEEYSFSPEDTKVDVRISDGMRLSINLESYVVGGYYELGQIELEICPGSGRT